MLTCTLAKKLRTDEAHTNRPAPRSRQRRLAYADAQPCLRPTEQPDAVVRMAAPLTPEEVFDLHATRVYNLARRMVNNPTDAEDITQDVLLQMVRKLSTFRGESEFTTWLHRLTVNAALGHRRSQAPRLGRQARNSLDYFILQGSEKDAACPRSPRPEKPLLDGEARRLIDEAVAALPEMYRTVFVLADIDGICNAEVASLTCLSMPAMKSRLHRARLLLREVLSPHFVEWAAQ